ncbi:hypothetical protein V8B97DRAFT_1301062 [Scleroderma yunnanense]
MGHRYADINLTGQKRLPRTLQHHSKARIRVLQRCHAILSADLAHREELTRTKIQLHCARQELVETKQKASFQVVLVHRNVSTNPSEVVTVSLSGPDLASGLQYGTTAGLPRLSDWFVGLQEHSHGRTCNEGWRLSTGSGSQDLIWKGMFQSEL